MKIPRRNAASLDIAAVRTRHPDVFRPLPRSRLLALAVLSGALGLLVLGVWRLELSPGRIAGGMGQLGGFLLLMVPPDPGSWPRLLLILRGLSETVAVAFLGTLLAAGLALPLGLLAARNTTLHGMVRFASRRVLDGVRGVDALIWALIWIGVVGLGPFAGVLAIMTSDIGTFGRLFSDALEAADRRPVEGVAAAGGGALARLRFGVLPQALPVMAGQALYMFESNTRSSTIIGIVGAGGIGLHLAEMIRTLEWQAVSCIVLLVLAVVAAIDAVSARLRAAIAGGPRSAATG
jgi:phosphonate transport system permease protein